VTWNLRRHRSLIRSCLTATTSADKGKALEDFLEYMFGEFGGVTVQHRDLRAPAQELDLVLYNDQLEQFFKSASAEIIVEAKNWATPVGAPEVNWFLDKMRQRGVTHGFLVAANGVTGQTLDRGDGAIDALYQVLQYGMRPVVLTLDDLSAIRSQAELLVLFKRRSCALFAKRLL
jgi:Restriction endonuclease